MKKNKLIILILLAFIILPIKVSAANVRVNIGCSKVTIGSTTECSITATSDVPINAIEGNISLSGAASIVSVTNSGWGMPLEVTSSHFSLLHDGDKSGGNKVEGVVNITIKGNVAGNATLSITGISGSDSSFETFTAANATKNIAVEAAYVPPAPVTVPTTKATTAPRITEATTIVTTERVYNVQLTSLVVGDFTVLPEEDKYYVTVNQDTTEVDIVATVEDGIELIGTGKRTLNVGKNVIDIITKSPNGLEGKFQVIITRPEDTTVHDTSLSSLKIVDYKIPFKKDTLEYTISVPSKATELYIIATSDNKDVVISGTGLQSLKKGENKLRIKVQFEDKASTEYVITVKRSNKETILIGLLITSSLLFIGSLFYNAIKPKSNNALPEENRNRERIENNINVPKEKEVTNQDKALGTGVNGVLKELSPNEAPVFAIKEQEELSTPIVTPLVSDPIITEPEIPLVEVSETTEPEIPLVEVSEITEPEVPLVEVSEITEPEVLPIKEDLPELNFEPLKVVNTETPTSDVNAFVPPVSTEQPEVKKQVKIIKKVVKPTPNVEGETNYKEEQVVINNNI